MQRRQRTASLLVAASLGLAGCGGGDGGDPTAFTRAADRTCRELSAEVAALRTGLVRASATSESAALALALGRYADAVDRTAGRLASAEPPKADAAFRTAAVQGLRRHATTMRRAAAQARRGRVAAGLRDELRGGALPTIPASVLRGAPDCAAQEG